MQNDQIKESVKKTFDDVANEYDNNKQFIISAQELVKLIECKKINPKILDLSTGTGNIAIELGKKFPNATIYGIDISKEMLNIAKEKTKKENLTNISYHFQDVENLEFRDIKFDIITCGYGLFFYPQMEKVFCDVYSRLDVGGKFIFSTFQESAFQPYSRIFLDMLEKNYSISPPKRLEKKPLQTKDEIIELSSLVTNQNFLIYPIEIRFDMNINKWWDLLNSTGYKGLLSQLNENYPQFEKEYLKHLYSLHKEGNIEFNADSFITIIGN